MCLVFCSVNEIVNINIDQYINMNGCPPSGDEPFESGLRSLTFLGGEAEVFTVVEPTLQDPTTPPPPCPWEVEAWDKWIFELVKMGF